MKLIVASPNGFCAGVERAISIVNEAINVFGAPIYVRHAIVHNNIVINELKEKGVVFVEDINVVPDNSILITSAHGISEELHDKINTRSINHIDATCPLVKKVHMQVKHLDKEGRKIFFIGHKSHPEAIGTCGYGKDIEVIETEACVDKIKHNDSTAYVTQTTLSIDNTRKIVDKLKAKFPNIKEPKKNDICYATSNRQNAVIKIASKCDIFFVFGSLTSSNSIRLVETAREHGCKNAFLVENDGEIDIQAISNNNAINTIGVSSGASCPDSVIQNFIKNIRSNNSDACVEISAVTKETEFFKLPTINETILKTPA